jgi:hypothetical protein
VESHESAPWVALPLPDAILKATLWQPNDLTAIVATNWQIAAAQFAADFLLFPCGRDNVNFN